MRCFVRRRARVVLWDINERGLVAVGKKLTQQNGGPVWYYVCDVTDRSARPVGVFALLSHPAVQGHGGTSSGARQGGARAATRSLRER